MYPVIGAPPLFLGGSHLSSTRSTSQFSISGVPGLPGTSKMRYLIIYCMYYNIYVYTKSKENLPNGFLAVIDLSVSSGSDSPSSFTALTLNL